MKVAIRDDDTCYFTAPETLERVYHDVWDRVPVCLATVPCAIGYERAGIPPEHWHSGAAFPLEQNRELVPFLKDAVTRRRVTIALHGYTHQDYPDGFEFQAAPDLAAAGARWPAGTRVTRSIRRFRCSCRRTTRSRSAGSRP